ncbi:hypothetical protein [Paraburkholderia sp. J67]|uniref:hypothetical protein n=1 Tax=Paraburkholderia sp. J67 TaxID=2805435 RepID=UPI002ABDE862|nr:hypothetical protein [Paraburkholderia sp. J67]
MGIVARWKGEANFVSKRLICFSVLFFFQLSLFAADKVIVHHGEEAQNSPNDRPNISVAPHSLLTVKGSKDPGIELVISVEYNTTNDNCRARTITQAIVGSPRIPQIVRDYAEIPSDVTSFSVEFFLDRYEPGPCQWKPGLVGHGEAQTGDIVGARTSTAGLAVVADDGASMVSVRLNCQEGINLPGIEPHIYLSCLPIWHSPGPNTTISSGGGEIQFSLIKQKTPPVQLFQFPKPASEFGKSEKYPL